MKYEHRSLYQFNVAYAQEWSDYRLTWNSTDFGNLTFLFVHASKMWTPDLLLTNRWDIQIVQQVRTKLHLLLCTIHR